MNTTDTNGPGLHPANQAEIGNAYDYNRDRVVGGLDTADGQIAASHQTAAPDALRLIAVPQE